MDYNAVEERVPLALHPRQTVYSIAFRKKKLVIVPRFTYFNIMKALFISLQVYSDASISRGEPSLLDIWPLEREGCKVGTITSS